MSKTLLITSFLFLVIALSGCDNFSVNENIDNDIEQQGRQNDSGKISSEQDESTKAEDALVSFFTHLENQDFEKALLFFELDDPVNDWEGLESFSPLTEDRRSKANVLKNYCEATGTCLEARVIETKKGNNDTYDLVIQFKNPDGSTFVLEPCCGATEEEMPAQDKFDFKVKKINNDLKVTTAPVYRP